METTALSELDEDKDVGEQPVPQISGLDLNYLGARKKLSKTHVFCRVECGIDTSRNDA